MERIKDIKKQLLVIIDDYSKTLFPKRYISDDKYIKLNKELKEFKEHLEVQKNKSSNIKYKKDTSNFDSLSDNVKKMIVNANYDLEIDKDNIINFHHKTNQSELSDKVMTARLKEFKISNKL